MSAAQKVFEQSKNKSKEEKKALYASLISVEDKLELYRLEKSKYFTTENALVSTTKTHTSPSGKYQLIVTEYKTDPGYGNYSLGTIQVNGEDLDTIQRNYRSFPYVFVENHPNGHDYLVCGEDYQGQTVIELDTGKRKDWVPSMGGFCWVNMTPSPSKNLIAVDGCYWACGYEIKIFEFSDPLNLPFECYTDKYMINEFTWNEDDSCNLEIEYDTRKSDGKPLFELSEEENDALEQALEPGANQNEIFGYGKKCIIWKK